MKTCVLLKRKNFYVYLIFFCLMKIYVLVKIYDDFIEDICFRRDFCLVKELDLFLCNKLYFNLDLELCLDEDVRLVNALCLYLGTDLDLDLRANVM